MCQTPGWYKRIGATMTPNIAILVYVENIKKQHIMVSYKSLFIKHPAPIITLPVHGNVIRT